MYPSWSDHMTEVFHFLLKEVALRRFQGDPRLPEQNKRLDEVLQVFLEGARKKNHIIQILNTSATAHRPGSYPWRVGTSQGRCTTQKGMRTHCHAPELHVKAVRCSSFSAAGICQ